MPMIAIPGYIVSISLEEESYLLDLFRRFGNARRRAYNLLRRGYKNSEIEALLQAEHRLNSRYIKDAYLSIKDLPSYWTCGGLKNQRLREKGRVSGEEYQARRNSIIISRGDKSRKGNLNNRLLFNRNDVELRVNICPIISDAPKWIYPKVFIPKKYLRKYGHLLQGDHSYTVYIKRKDNGKGYDLRVVVGISGGKLELLEQRVMALDINAGFIDFAVAEPHRVLTVGRINCHEVQHASTGKTMSILHKAADKIINIARHYKARVVLGNLNTARYRGWGARKIKGIPHHRLAHILEYKFNMERRSEAYTSKLAEKISHRVGLDVHKVAAALFALKVLDYPSFSSLKDEFFPRGVASDEGEGSLRRRLNAGSGLTAPGQAYNGGDTSPNGLACDEAVENGGGYPAIPGSGGLSDFLESLENNLPCLNLRLC